MELLGRVGESVEKQLPDSQARALLIVLHGSAVPAPDRYTIGGALLALLARLAEPGPVLCVVDDAQRLEQSSADALLLAAGGTLRCASGGMSTCASTCASRRVSGRASRVSRPIHALVATYGPA
ncbi:hypothetical protein ABZ934_30245 [Streptomyces sp. NPDC046557]|uniref:hypothetical protein n=1 Tax=Streptomyces sp. NPDC046557 TaxID=3155372 RepID=UPI0033E0D5D8